MASSVFFKFRSQKESQRIPFDGTGISVFELKREIITLSKLGDNKDFDLSIFNADTNDEYQDDTEIIPRGTSVTAARRPAAIKGRGNGARYVTGRAPVKALNAHRLEKNASASSKAVNQPPVMPKPADLVNLSEEDRISQMLAMNADQWKQQSDQMAGARKVYSGSYQNRGGKSSVPDRPIPANYVCYRCGQKGHFIQACPTNDDPNFENKVRIKRTTGIPRSFLKTIERPLALDGSSLDAKSLPPGVMVNGDGEFVIAEPDTKAWERFQAKQKITAAAQEADEALSKELEDKGLACPIDRKLYNRPTKTPCCGKTFCHDCISNSLMENDFKCPECDTTPVLLDDLKDDPEVEVQVKAYKAAKSGEQISLNAKGTAPGSPKGSEIVVKVESLDEGNAHLALPVNGGQGISASPIPTIVRPSSTESSASRKRKANDDLENPRGSKAPSPIIKREPSPVPEADETGADAPKETSDIDSSSGTGTAAAEDDALQNDGESAAKNQAVAADRPDSNTAVAAASDEPNSSTPSISQNNFDLPGWSVNNMTPSSAAVPAMNMAAFAPNVNTNWMATMGGMMGMTPAAMNQMMAMNNNNNLGAMNLNMGMQGTGFNPALMGMNPMMGMMNPMMGMGMMNPMMGGMGMNGMGGMGAVAGMGGNQFGNQQQQQNQQNQNQNQGAYFPANRGGVGGVGQQWRGARGNRGRRGGKWRSNEQVYQ